MSPIHPLIKHIENHLGNISYSWKSKNEDYRIFANLFNDQPEEGVNTFVTTGLSDHILTISEDKSVRQELVFIADTSFKEESIASFLLTFSEFILKKHQALLRGEVIGPANPVIPDTSMNAIYASIPVIFDDSFTIFDAVSPPAVFVWLIPIYEQEAEFLHEQGWEEFEDLLVEQNPDLFDLKRKSLVD
jgi:hypothetical protein